MDIKDGSLTEFENLKIIQDHIQRNISKLLNANSNDVTSLPLILNNSALTFPATNNSSALVSADSIPVLRDDDTSPQTHMLNSNKYFRMVRKILPGEYDTNPNEYPAPVHRILDQSFKFLTSIPITKLGSIPRKRSLMAELHNVGRHNNSTFTFGLKDATWGQLSKDIQSDNFGSGLSSSMDNLTININPFGEGSPIQYSFTFKNWFTGKIRQLQDQIADIDRLLQGNAPLTKKFTIPKIYTQLSPHRSTQLLLMRQNKQRQLQYFSYCNRALAEVITQTEKGERIYKDKLRLTIANMDDFTLQSLISGTSPIFSSASAADIKHDTEKLLTRISSYLKGDYDKEYEYKSILATLDNINLKDTTLQNNLTNLLDLYLIDDQIIEKVSQDLRIPKNNINTILQKLSTNQELQDPQSIKKLLGKTALKNGISGKNKNFNDLINKSKSFLMYVSLLKYVSLYSTNSTSIPSSEELLRAILLAIPSSLATIITVTDIAVPAHPDRIKVALLRKILDNILLESGFAIDDSFDFLNHKAIWFQTGSIQLLPDPALGSHKVMLKITFPRPPIKSSKLDFTNDNIMGIDLGLRDLCSYAIRTKGIDTEFPNVIPDILAPADFITGHSITPAYQKSATRLNRSSKFLQRSVSKYQAFQERYRSPKEPRLSNLSFNSQDKRLFYVLNLRKAISSHQRKKSDTNKTTVHMVSNDLIKLALHFKVKQFNFEDLQNFQSAVPAGARAWSYRYSNNLFGQILTILDYKVRLFGFTSSVIKKCNPDYTSQLCPLQVIQDNVLLPDTSSSNHANVPNRKALLLKTCKTYSDGDDGPVPNKMGHWFIHSYHHANTVVPNSQVALNRDISAATVLTYCHTNNYHVPEADMPDNPQDGLEVDEYVIGIEGQGHDGQMDDIEENS